METLLVLRPVVINDTTDTHQYLDGTRVLGVDGLKNKDAQNDTPGR